jgi:hypothetical protein
MTKAEQTRLTAWRLKVLRQARASAHIAPGVTSAVAVAARARRFILRWRERLGRSQGVTVKVMSSFAYWKPSCA